MIFKINFIKFKFLRRSALVGKTREVIGKTLLKRVKLKQLERIKYDKLNPEEVRQNCGNVR